MPRPIILATRNEKKVVELARLLQDLPYKVVSLAAYPDMPDTEETGATFAENARLKALAAARYTGQLALADDSGLAVDALGGEPGVYSARYAGEVGKRSDEANNKRLLERLADVPVEKRTARFICAVAIATPENVIWEGEGRVEGRIGTELKGRPDSFGYDPVFYPEGFEKTFDDMRPEEKDEISHRGRALLLAKDFLKHLTDQ